MVLIKDGPFPGILPAERHRFLQQAGADALGAIAAFDGPGADDCCKAWACGIFGLSFRFGIRFLLLGRFFRILFRGRRRRRRRRQTQHDGANDLVPIFRHEDDSLILSFLLLVQPSPRTRPLRQLDIPARRVPDPRQPRHHAPGHRCQDQPQIAAVVVQRTENDRQHGSRDGQDGRVRDHRPAGLLPLLGDAVRDKPQGVDAVVFRSGLVGC